MSLPNECICRVAAGLVYHVVGEDVGLEFAKAHAFARVAAEAGLSRLGAICAQFVVENGFVGLLQAITVHFPFVDLVCGPLKSSTLLSSCMAESKTRR